MEKGISQHIEVWQQALALLQKELNPVTCRTFINDLKPVAIQNSALVLQAPNEVIQTSLEKFYEASILAQVVQVSDSIDQVLFILPNDTAHYTPRPEIPGLFSSSPLYSKYTFDTFVVGSSNHFAHAAACAVAERPAKAYNPLFLYSGVGLGKTHLMHAIGHQVRAVNPHAHVMYVTSEAFTNEMIQSIATNRNREFRNRYRNVDVLMVDDIQFIARKEGVQEEFFHTFNDLHSASKQIIISSDKPPREIAQLEERLRSRFEWGLIADNQPPDLETRIAILRRRAELDKRRVPSAVVEFIAENVQSNIRELEGSLTRVIAYAQFNRIELTDTIAAEALKDIISNDPPVQITPQLIKVTIADFYGVEIEALSAKRRDQEIAFPRQVAMYLSRTLTDWSLSQIGDAFGGRNHTTVMHAHDKIAEQMRSDPALDKSIKDLSKRILEK